MGVERHFLGWDGPALPRAAAWLRGRFAQGGSCDLSRVIVVTPSARAGRRLLELLVEEAEAARLALAPPAMITPGRLPERLYKCDDAAADLLCQLARVKTLREMDGDVLSRLIAEPPGHEDLRGWWALAEELGDLADELAAEGLSAADVAAASADPERWRLIAEVEAACARCLEEQGLVDCHAARRRALEAGGCEAGGPVVLVGVVDLPRTIRRFLEALTSEVVALVAAPPEEAEAFDAWGGLVVEAWAERKVEIDDERWVAADRPRDQARAVLDALGRFTAARELTPDAVTVGLGDAALGPVVARTLDAAGVPARLAAGRPVSQTRPALLLDAVARYLRTRRFDDFAALLRHPDVPVSGAGVGDWLTLLDRYATDHLQGRVTGRWLGELAPRLKTIHDALHAALPMDADEPRPAPAWVDAIVAFLAEAYGRRPLRRYDDEDALVIEALASIRGRLDALGGLDAAGPCTPSVPLHGAIELLLAQLSSDALPGRGGEPAVELVGFLELPLDDAAAVVLTGLNEGAIPSSVASDPLLPGGLRASLGLSDNQRRVARDTYALLSILHARRDVVLISGRRTAEGDPLTPSRLLLRCEPARMAARLRRFYDETPTLRAAPPLLLPGVKDGPSRFAVPPPGLQGVPGFPGAGTPITRLRVTAFRDYLACPYRFYLRHVLRLRGMDDAAVEMDGGAFGTIAHRVLRGFGVSDLAQETHADTIARFLSSELDREVKERFGDEPGAAVVLQREQLRERLTAFAHWQAEQARQGWRILADRIERRCEAPFDVDGEPFTITGDIDRIDEHPEFGHRVIDYKTRDSGDTPEKTHRAGPKREKRWVDLQLPLYRLLAGTVGCNGAIELGYVQLPRDLGQVGWTPAEWDADELRDAEERAREIVRAIRAGVFWPPADAPAYEDEFVAICFDRIDGRRAAIELGAHLAAENGGNGDA